MIDWDTIVAQHGPDVWRTAYRLISDREQANDCYQETFLQAVAYARRHQVENWGSVLKRIATARAFDCLRRRYRRGAAPLASEGPVDLREQLPEQPAEMREWMEQLRVALSQLPERQAEAFWLCEVELLGRDVVARRLDSSPRQVAVWLHRGKRKLRTLMAAGGIENKVQP